MRRAVAFTTGVEERPRVGEDLREVGAVAEVVMRDDEDVIVCGARAQSEPQSSALVFDVDELLPERLGCVAPRTRADVPLDEHQGNDSGTHARRVPRRLRTRR